MDHSIVNVIVDLERGLDPARLHEVRSTLADLAGVVRAQPSERLERMMLGRLRPARDQRAGHPGERAATRPGRASRRDVAGRPQRACWRDRRQGPE
ncbi:MAG: hypothetical protein IT515_14265 [Burkholderiales bacterium]|nr:hypothetical protein [Burkholderiales bacterium]